MARTRSLTTTSEYYDAFVSIRRGLFNTRDRAEHTRKRKVVSHTFSAKSIGQFEQYIHANLELFVQKWTKLSDTRKDPSTGYASIDALHWFNYLAFDIIGDLAFGAPFGMLEREKDYAEIRLSPDAPPSSAPAIEVLNRRGEVSGTLGCLPQLKPWAKHMPDPFFSKGVEAVENLAGIAIARVKQRLDNPNTDRVDLLARLMEGKDAKGEKLGREELTAEALTQLIAGSDTTSNTACALLYYVVRTPRPADPPGRTRRGHPPGRAQLRRRQGPALCAVGHQRDHAHPQHQQPGPAEARPVRDPRESAPPGHRDLGVQLPARPRAQRAELHDPPQQGDLGPRRR